MSLLEVQGISKSFKKRKVVDSISFSVKSGQMIGLLGPNGAGKTISFYITVGLVAPDEGLVQLDKKNIGHLPLFKRARRGLSYLPQEISIFRRLTVKENLLIALEAHGYKGPSKRERLEYLLNKFKISHLTHSLGYSLSGGERRRVEIARALAGRPKFLFLDEPFAEVDPIAVEDLKGILDLLVKDQSIGILITDHNARAVMGTCDKVYILSEGQIRVHGTAQEVAANPMARKFYLGENFSL